jgi:SRSO17 transposase
MFRLALRQTEGLKKGSHSVGVAPQYASALGKNANCQTLVSVTLAGGEVPLMVGLRWFLPEHWTSAPARMDRARVPPDLQTFRSKPAIAIDEIDRVRAAGVRFGCVLGDAGYGLSAPSRHALSARGLQWAKLAKVPPAKPVEGQRRGLAFRASRRSMRPMWRWSSLSQAAAGRASGTSPIASRSRRRPCSWTHPGDRSAGAAARTAACRRWRQHRTQPHRVRRGGAGLQRL